MRKGRLDIINICKYLMVIALIAYVVLLVSGEGDNTVSVDTIQKNIEKSVSLKGMKKGSSQDLKKYYGLNANDYAGTMLYIPDDVMSVNEILVVKVKDKSQVEDVEKAVEERLSTQKKSFEGYGVKQTRLLHSAIDETRGYYILLAVSKDADRIEAAFKNSLYEKAVELERCYLAVLFFYLHFYRLCWCCIICCRRDSTIRFCCLQV